jgi:hypothetical protein
MLKRDPNYQRLKAGSRSMLGQSSYWLGPNHLLVVEVTNYVERYRRFYFRDVQAILVQHSQRRFWWNLALGICLAVALLIFLVVAFPALQRGFNNADYFITGAWLAMALLFTTFLLVNTLRGPTCAVYLRTAVQTQKLTGLSRQHKAAGFVAALQPRIEAAQAPSAADAQSPDAAPSPPPP